jgi:hypothetical protein
MDNKTPNMTVKTEVLAPQFLRAPFADNVSRTSQKFSAETLKVAATMVRRVLSGESL